MRTPTDGWITTVDHTLAGPCWAVEDTELTGTLKKGWSNEQSNT
jgi:hypothetical protein